MSHAPAPSPDEQALRSLLTTATDTIDADPDRGWDVLQARLQDVSAGDGRSGPRHGVSRPRTRLLVAAAVLVAILGTALVAARGGGGDDGNVDVVDDTTTTTTASRTTTTSTVLTTTTPLIPGAQPDEGVGRGGPATPTDPGTSATGQPGAERPAPGPSGADPGPTPGSDAPTTTTTTTPAPPPRATPEVTWDTGDYVVELVLDPASTRDVPSLFLRRTDDVGTRPGPYQRPDAYGWFTDHFWSLSEGWARCSAYLSIDITPSPDHTILVGIAGPGVGTMTLVTASGQRRPLALGRYVPSIDAHAVLGQPLPSTQTVEVADTTGTIVATIPYGTGMYTGADC